MESISQEGISLHTSILMPYSKPAKSLPPLAPCTFLVLHPIVLQFSAFIQEKAPSLNALFSFQPMAETIAMSDHPLGAIRRKRNSSLVVGMRMLKKRQLDAFISCGNTGALIASAALSLHKLPGVKRPALLATLPTMRGSVAVLDVGGNVSCKSLHLLQFAFLGTAYQAAVSAIALPRVGLLNIGSESKKGTEEVRQAYELLKSDPRAQSVMQFVGNVEGRDIFKGVVDVLVTDGFTGNVLLKTAEGVASFIFEKLGEVVQGSAFTDAFGEMKTHFNYNEYPGAIVCGVEGIVIKIHGGAAPKTMYNSILAAAQAVRKEHVGRLKAKLKSYEGLIKDKDHNDTKEIKDTN